MSTIVLPPPVRAVIETDALDRWPLEACGIVIGESTGDSQRVVAGSACPESNVHPGDRRHRFAIASERVLRAQRAAREAGLEIIGYYHSHADSSAIPSARDLSTAWPGVSYLIVEVAEGVIGSLRSWRLDPEGTAFLEERVEYAG